MKSFLTFLFSTLFLLTTSAQDNPAYRLYNAKGKKTTYKKLIKEAKKADVVLFGEFHNNPISHWLQYEFTKDMHVKRDLVLGFEMIERDNQDELNDYLEDRIDQEALDTIARLWKNYKTDYKPLVDFAKKKKIDVCACNIPRRFASKVFKGGLETLENLNNSKKEWIAPLPIPYDADLPGYVKMQEMMGGHGGENLPKAQAIKDATMAHFIIKSLEKNQLMIHYNGSYHSNNYEGIVWYLQKYKPELKILTITTESVKNVKKYMKDGAKADFIIQVDENMTTTY